MVAASGSTVMERRFAVAETELLVAILISLGIGRWLNDWPIGVAGNCAVPANGRNRSPRLRTGGFQVGRPLRRPTFALWLEAHQKVPRTLSSSYYIYHYSGRGVGFTAFETIRLVGSFAL